MVEKLKVNSLYYLTKIDMKLKYQIRYEIITYVSRKLTIRSMFQKWSPFAYFSQTNILNYHKNYKKKANPRHP